MGRSPYVLAHGQLRCGRVPLQGAGSLGKVARKTYEVVSLDISDKYRPDIVANILDFDFSLLQPG